MADDQVLTFIELAYAAALDSARWDEFLTALSAALRAPCGVLHFAGDAEALVPGGVQLTTISLPFPNPFDTLSFSAVASDRASLVAGQALNSIGAGPESTQSWSQGIGDQPTSYLVEVRRSPIGQILATVPVVGSTFTTTAPSGISFLRVIAVLGEATSLSNQSY